MLWFAILSFTAACAPAPEPPTPTLPPPTIPPSPTATQLPTSVPLPTATATTEPPGLLFTDDFSIDRGWQLTQGASGAISLLNQRLVISVRGPSGLLFSLSPFPEQHDFVLQVQVRSEICDGDDEFGLMVRARSLETHYRFSLTCDGSVRASRFLAGSEAALAPSTPTDAAIRGAPAENRLQLEAVGSQLIFSVNQIQVIEVNDSRIESGGIGLFVRVRRSPQATFSFDDFILSSPSSSSDSSQLPGSSPRLSARNLGGGADQPAAGD